MKILFYIALMCHLTHYAQEFTSSDTLRGALLPERAWFDVHYYHLSLNICPTTKSIDGYNDVSFKVIKSSDLMQLDLFKSMKIDSIVFEGLELEFHRVHNSFFIRFPDTLSVKSQNSLRIYYRGQPQQAKNAPWDGGFVWKSDSSGHPWIGVACQGLGASSWWPCKDHLSDEPDSMRITCEVPKEVRFIGNGTLESDFFKDGNRVSTWQVNYPINNYNVSLNIADYSHLTDLHILGDDTLHLDYYVLKGNELKAEAHFKQVKPMLLIYQELFDIYPFWDDGYALVETPYLGMEHQSAIAYGNEYKPGYLGRYPGNMDFDFIIIHETGHEYWGNSVSMNDIADMWIHESFCTYTEALYVEKMYGYESMLDYLMYQKDFITNSTPIQGHRHVNDKGNGTDMYYKGSWMLHSIRNTIDDDALWFRIIKSVYTKFALSNCNGTDIISYMSKLADRDLEPIFNQFLKYADLPVFVYNFNKNGNKLVMDYRWNTPGYFDMPVVIYDVKSNEFRRIHPTETTNSIYLGDVNLADIKIVENLFLFEKLKE